MIPSHNQITWINCVYLYPALRNVHHFNINCVPAKLSIRECLQILRRMKQIGQTMFLNPESCVNVLFSGQVKKGC